MKTEVLTLNSYDDLLSFINDLENILKAPYKITLGDKFPRRLRMTIKGGDFDGTITPSIMQGFVYLQNMIYQIYETQHGGITAIEKQQLEFHVSVKKGSGIAEAILDKTISVLVEQNVVSSGQMTGGHILGALGIIAAAYLGNTFIKEAFRSQRKKIEEATKTERDATTHKTLQSALDAITTICSTQNKVANELAKPQYDTIELQNQVFTPQALKEYAKETKEKHENTTHSETSDFIITLMQVDFEKDISFINVVHSDSQELYKKVIIQKADVENQEMIHKANEGDTVNLTLIVTRTEENEIKKVILDSINEQ